MLCFILTVFYVSLLFLLFNPQSYVDSRFNASPSQIETVKPFFPNYTLCESKRCHVAPNKLTLPERTRDGRPTVDLIQTRLRNAWKDKLGTSVDLYVRSGCVTLEWLIWMLQSAEIFFPNFLGKIIVVLDSNDDFSAKHVLQFAETSNHSIVIKFEDVPCMPPRVFNQLSYFNAWRWSNAEYIVTIDSDCVFHTPVTPSLLFKDGKSILPTSYHFQPGMWDQWVKYYTHYDINPPGHSMITQPVTFRRDTLKNYWTFIHKIHGKSLYDVIADMHSKFKPGSFGNFCWMCQISSYAYYNERDKYHFNLLHQSFEPYLRFALHWKYETWHIKDFRERAIGGILGGLVTHFKQEFDAPVKYLKYVDRFQYRYYNNQYLCVRCTSDSYMKRTGELEKELSVSQT
jgi:hypothetical protein